MVVLHTNADRTTNAELSTQATEQPLLRCPTCGGDLHVTLHRDSFGLATCCGRELPIVDRVLMTEPDARTARAAAAIHEGNAELAQRMLLAKHASRVSWMRRLGMRVTFRRFTRHWLLAQLITRTALLRVLAGRSGKLAHNIAAAALFNVYLRHRFCAPALAAIIPFLGLSRCVRRPILDAPCGTGHLSAVLSRVVRRQRIVAMDLHPPFVWATRHFFAPELHLGIAHDMCRALPLRDRSIGAAFCLDAFQYIPCKAHLASEFMRILDDDDGVLVIAHAQNRLHPNRWSGQPLSPAEYAALFEGYHVRMFPESYAMQAYLENAPLDLSRRFSTDELNEHDRIQIVVSKTARHFRAIEPVNEEAVYSPRNPRLNPLYRARRVGDEYVLERRLPPGLDHVYARYTGFLPERVTVPLSEVRVSANRTIQFNDPRELLLRHVLVDLPELY